ncbi:hypothetical protein BDZ45DRAFT_752445 [Acephala macrosclerotiorum]|nr:hypothetical protein BDZ45DRAFT_752445 [Acephala macrosclerotiorum]
MTANLKDEPAMVSRASLEKPVGDVELAENAPAHNAQQPHAQSVNLKLNCIILPVLALNFMLCEIDKANIGNAATTNKVILSNIRLMPS